MTVSYQYDAGGNRTRLTYPDNTYVSYEYDTLNRMTYVRSQSGTALAHYTYDALSRRSDLDYANGAYADYSYDTAGRVLYVDNRTNNGQHKYAYTYDYVGNRSTMIVTSGGASRTHVYSYDATYQLTHVDYPPELSYLATDTTFDYDAAGNRTSVIDGSGTTPYSTNSLNQYTAADGTSFQYDASGNMTHDATYAYGYDPENRLVKVHKSGSLPPPTLSQALDSGLTYTTGGADIWRVTSGESYQGMYSAQSGNIDDEQESYLQTQVTGSGTITFWWKVSSEPYYDYLEFWVDGVLQSGPISGNVDWEQKSYPVSGAGTHTLKWRYIKDGSVSTGEDCGWVDWVQWSGSSPPAPEPDPAAWRTLLYRYDAAGRRVEKKYDDNVVTQYVYDGDHCLAEYDVSGNLRRKYIYGPGIDQPVCMIEAAGTYAGTYYYHFDALGNVVALTSGNVDHMGETVQVYDYDVYGRVGATDASHPNRFMFTGREFDKETGLYYYRARYYKPEIGRFLQVDPVGYDAGMNLYRYCNNNPWNYKDPLGLEPNASEPNEPNVSNEPNKPKCKEISASGTARFYLLPNESGFPVVLPAGDNSASLSLSGVSCDGKTFKEQPKVRQSRPRKNVFFNEDDGDDPSIIPHSGPWTMPDGQGGRIQCYTKSVNYRWDYKWQPQLLIGEPSVYWMKATITLIICADGTASATITHSQSLAATLGLWGFQQEGTSGSKDVSP